MCPCVLAASAADKYGAFAPLIGIVGGLVATAGALGFAWRGPMKRWEVPDEDFPNIQNNVVTLINTALIVTGWFLATPQNIGWILLVGIGLATVAVVGVVIYAGQVRRHRYYRLTPAGKGATKKIFLLGGDVVQPEAEKIMQERGFTPQDYLPGTPPRPWNADHIWTRDSRVRVAQKIIVTFMITLFAGTVALAWLGFVVQVKLTGKPAAEVIYAKDVPTLEGHRP
jgi:hypothetical protein